MEPDHLKELKDLIQKAEKNRLVAGVNDILQYLKANGNLRSQKLESHLVGCHMEKMSGMMLSTFSMACTPSVSIHPSLTR